MNIDNYGVQIEKLTFELNTIKAASTEKDAELAELNSLFDLQRTRMGEATKAWRVANPGNDLVSPDLGNLLTWLLRRIAELQQALKEEISEVEWYEDNRRQLDQRIEKLRELLSDVCHERSHLNPEQCLSDCPRCAFDKLENDL